MCPLGELFALCPYNPATNSVEAVLDSSRYFVLKIEHEGTLSNATTTICRCLYISKEKMIKYHYYH